MDNQMFALFKKKKKQPKTLSLFSTVYHIHVDSK